MFPDRQTQQGFAIVSAIFLIVVLALLGISMTRVFTSGQQAINQDITSLQAYYAGQSGLQWGMYQSVYASTDAAGNHTVSFSNAGLAGSRVTVRVQANTILAQNYFLLDARGEYGNAGNPEHAQRQLQLRFNP